MTYQQVSRAIKLDRDSRVIKLEGDSRVINLERGIFVIPPKLK